MRFILAAAIAGLLASPATADTQANCDTAWKGMTPAQQAVMTEKAWNAKCVAKDYMVPPNESQIPAGATAMCKDNTYSMAKDAKEQCMGHGGVARTL